MSDFFRNLAEDLKDADELEAVQTVKEEVAAMKYQKKR